MFILIMENMTTVFPFRLSNEGFDNIEFQTPTPFDDDGSCGTQHMSLLKK